ncbi:unnamed protein product [Gongylonema pulchrum]|uniref:Nudix hydrolase domain-containing protein n=1 Tax=Gongylonema pulchrum TaxID=637853 RepID=A0A183EW47_9BILA|nr:unnamed protein product [Gongylonema pulchrum]
MQNKYMEEQCIIVDEQDKPLRPGTKRFCHSSETSRNVFLQNEGDIGVRRAAKRKLNHELGIERVDIEQMEVMGRFLYKSVMHNNKWGEHEIDHALVIRDFDVEQLRRNPEEVDEIAILFVLGNEVSFSPWFQLFVQHNILQKWWQNLDCLDSLKDFDTIKRLN